MARRRRGFGYVSIRNRSTKIARSRNLRGGASEMTRTLGVKVFIQRGNQPTNYTYGGGYWAWACTAKPKKSGERQSNYTALAEHRRKACGPEVFGRTPTMAAKKALVALGKKKELR